MFLGPSSLLTVLASLVAVLALVWAGSRLARFSGYAPRQCGSRLLTIQDSIALDSHRRLLVVRCGTRDVMLLTGGAQDVVLGWLSQSSSWVSDQRYDAEPEK
jgi:flagellar protein FliO/FliZ